jgi:SNF2 family DNA or RNA helicase
MTTTAELLHAAASALASRCDFAEDQDGAGYNKPDTHFGHNLANVPHHLWTAETTRTAWEVLGKYKEQLKGLGIDWDAIPVPIEAVASRNIKAIQVEGEAALICFPYSRALVDKVKELPGRRWNKARKVWGVPLTKTTAPALIAFAKENDFAIDPAIASGNYDEAPEVEAADLNNKAIDLVAGVYQIRFPYDPDLVTAVKTITGRKWDKEAKMWTAPATQAAMADLVAFATQNDFPLPDGLKEQAKRAVRAIQKAKKASRATDANIKIDGLGGELLPFQRAGVRYAVTNGRCLIADEMGLGKTIQAIAATQGRDAFPALIVVPASLKLNWQREFGTWLPGRTVTIVSGTKNGAGLPEADVTVINYDILTSWLTELKGRGFKALILDESHYVKNAKAKRTKAAKALAEQTDTVLLLTGTPVLNRPSELISQLEILGVLDGVFGGFWPFAKRYCKAYRGRWGLDLSGADNLQELNEKLRGSCMVRRRKEDVLTELPPKRRSVIPLELDNRADYLAAEADVCAHVADKALEAAEFKASLKGLTENQKKAAKAKRWVDAERKAEAAEQLVRIEALKQVAVEGKMAAAFDWIDAFLESGEKLVLFATHKAITKALADRYKAPKITGDTPAAKRQEAVDAFQGDPACQVIVGNIKAMGVGLTLTAASNVAFLELGWTPADHDQAEDRCHRIGQADSVNAYYLVADQTIDNEIFDLIQAKRQVVDGATDGKAARKVSILSELIKGLRRRGGGEGA